MRKLLLSMALVLLGGVTMAQGTIDLSFEKTSATAATVTVTGSSIDVTGITATVTANYNWKSLTANNNTFPTVSMLCPDKNTSQMTGDAAGVFTITLNNVPDNYSFTNTVFTSAALTASGTFQEHTETRHVNFTLKQGENTLGTIIDHSIMVHSGNGQAVTTAFDIENKYYAEDGTLVLTLTLEKGTNNNGCFYGLTKVSLTTEAEEVVEPTAETSYKLTQVTASELMEKTTATRIAIKNLAFNNHYWLDIKETTGNNSPAEYSEDVVFIWEPVEENTAGVYYLKDLDGNYLQKYTSEQTDENRYISLGTIDNAAKFKAVCPTLTTGSTATTFSYDNASKIFSESNQSNIVRFVTLGDDNTTTGHWINTQQPTQRAKYNSGQGTFTIHFAYEQTEANSFTADFTKGEYASFYAPGNITIPEGIEAYYLNSEGITSDKASLTKIENGIIPAFTAVILYSNRNEVVTLNVTDDEAAPISGNILKGTLVEGHVDISHNTNANAYVLAKPENADIGLYKIETTSITNQNISSTLFTSKANKAYLPASAVPVAAASSVGFRFDFATTAVEKVEMRNEKEEIYDLQGRRIDEITEPGIYIVNGVKVLVR